MSFEKYDDYRMLARLILSHKDWDGHLQLALYGGPKGDLLGFRVDQNASLFSSPLRYDSELLKEQRLDGPDQVQDWLASIIGKNQLNGDLKCKLLFYSLAAGEEGECITESIDPQGNSKFVRGYSGWSAASEADDLIPHSYEEELSLEEAVKISSKNGRMMVESMRYGNVWVAPLEWRAYLIEVWARLVT